MIGEDAIGLIEAPTADGGLGMVVPAEVSIWTHSGVIESIPRSADKLTNQMMTIKVM